MVKIYSYIRVSTTRQSEEGESLEVQQRKLQAYAQQHDWLIDGVYRDEGVSGSIPLKQRPAGGALLSVLRPGDIVIAVKLDRCFRSSLDALQTIKLLEKSDVDLHLLDLGGSVVDSGISKMLFAMMSSFAEFERVRIGERIREVKADQRARNRFLGGSRPFGFNVRDGNLVVNREEQGYVRQMRLLREQGLSYRAIAGTLRALGCEVSNVTVRRLLARGDREVAFAVFPVEIWCGCRKLQRTTRIRAGKTMEAWGKVAIKATPSLYAALCVEDEVEQEHVIALCNEAGVTLAEKQLPESGWFSVEEVQKVGEYLFVEPFGDDWEPVLQSLTEQGQQVEVIGYLYDECLNIHVYHRNEKFSEASHFVEAAVTQAVDCIKNAIAMLPVDVADAFEGFEEGLDVEGSEEGLLDSVSQEARRLNKLEALLQGLEYYFGLWGYVALAGLFVYAATSYVQLPWWGTGYALLLIGIFLAENHPGRYQSELFDGAKEESQPQRWFRFSYYFSTLCLLVMFFQEGRGSVYPYLYLGLSAYCIGISFWCMAVELFGSTDKQTKDADADIFSNLLDWGLFVIIFGGGIAFAITGSVRLLGGG